MSRPEAPTANIASLLRRVASSQPEGTAVVDTDGSTTTYRELFARAGRFARVLDASQVGIGDRVALWMRDDAAHVVAYLACAQVGAVVVPLNTRYTVHEAAGILQDCDPRVLVWHESKDEEAAALLDSAGAADLLRVRHAPSGQPGPTALAWDDVTGQGDPRLVTVPVASDAPVIIGYTSGTTGTPKGAVMTHGSVAAVMRQNAAAYRLPARSVIAMTGSMSFVSVVPAHVLTHLAVAGTIVFNDRWTVPSLLDTIEQHRATFTYLPSPVLAEFSEAAAQAPSRWQSLTSVLHSASKASAEDLHGLADVIGSRLVEGWGMTENSGGLMTATSAMDIDDRRTASDPLATVGRPLPDYEVKAVDDELLVRGPGVVRGYWRNPEATAAAFQDGWFRTGDVGTVDERGYVTVLERRTDLIVSGGMNVYPAEVEAVIAALPEVAEVAVVGVPHPRWGQTVVAMVVPAPGHQVDAARIEAHCRERLASYKKPTEIVLAQDLPRTTSLKVSRAAVRQRLVGGLVGSGT